MKRGPDEDAMRPEYDFSSRVRGKHYEAYRRGTNVVLLEPDVAAVFKDSAAVNAALRALAHVARAHTPTASGGREGRRGNSGSRRFPRLG